MPTKIKWFLVVAHEQKKQINQIGSTNLVLIIRISNPSPPANIFQFKLTNNVNPPTENDICAQLAQRVLYFIT